MADLSTSFDPSLVALNSDAASSALAEADAASVVAASASSKIAAQSAAWEAAASGITSNLIAAGETVTIAANEQLIIEEDYYIDGTGILIVNDSGKVTVENGKGAFEGFSVADRTKLDAVVDPVLESDFDAYSILVANSDNTPVVLNIPANSLIGRISGNIVVLGANTLRTFQGESSGTFTAGLICGTSGTITLGTFYVMRYRKSVWSATQDKIEIIGYIAVTAISSPVGTLSLTGLPVACAADAGSLGGFSVYADNLEATADTAIQARAVSSQTYLRLSAFKDGEALNLAAEVKVGTAFYISGFYLTA